MTCTVNGIYLYKANSIIPIDCVAVVSPMFDFFFLRKVLPGNRRVHYINENVDI